MSEHSTNRGRIVAAVILISLGLLFLFGNLEMLHLGRVIGTFWPVILIGVGISRLNSGGKNDLGGALFFIGLGSLFLLNNLDILSGDIIDYWPLILILLGVWILFKPRLLERTRDTQSASTSGASEGRVNQLTIFGGQEHPVQSDNFSGGDVTVIFGGSKLDLRQVGTEQKEIHIEVTAIFSGLDIIMPANWSLDLGITPLFGSVEDKRRTVLQKQLDEPVRLFLHGSSIFSGIEISS
jgi:predicted membrane protein